MRQLPRSSNSLWSVVANLTFAITQWLLLVVVARVGEPAQLGEYAFALALAAPVFMATNMRLRFVQSAGIAHRFDLATFARVRLTSSVLAIAASLLLGVTAGLSEAQLTLLACVSLFKSVEAAQDVALGQYQQAQRMDQAALSHIVAGLCALSAFFAAFSLTHELYIAALSVFAAKLLAVLTVDLTRAPRFAKASTADHFESSTARPHASRARKAFELLNVSWPLGIVACLDSLNANIPRYFLALSVSDRELGLFAAMAYFLFAGFVVVNSIGQAWMSTLTKAWSTEDWSTFSRTARDLLCVAAGVGLAGVVFAWTVGKELVLVVYGPQFIVNGVSFALIMAAGALSYIALATIYLLSAANRLTGQVWLYGCNSVAVLVASYWLIPRFGIEGAAIALCLGHAVQIVFSILIRRGSHFLGGAP